MHIVDGSVAHRARSSDERGTPVGLQIHHGKLLPLWIERYCGRIVEPMEDWLS